MKRLFGLIGASLQHSFSADFFTSFFAKNNIADAEYRNFELASIDAVKELFAIPELQGLNVTIPYKEQVLPFLHELDPVAAAIGAVNCIQRTPEGWKGYNTDAVGFRNSLRPLLHPRHDKALVLGSGGASKAVQYVLKELGIPFQVVSGSHVPGTIPYEEVTEKKVHEHLLIINCTPLGMFPNISDSPNLPYHALGKRHLLYDLIYRPKISEFLRSGMEMGAKVKNGQEMLEIQAMESWKIWNGEIFTK